MTIWILAFVLVVAAVSAGYAQGAIRVAFSLLGIIVGIFLAMPLGPMVMPLLPFVGIDNAFAKAVVGPIVAFFLVGVVFKIAGAFVHRKIEYHYKYRMSDAQRSLWERMNRRIGAALGSIGGAIYFVLVCLLVSVLGYFTLQVGAAESSSSSLKFMTKMAEDLRATHMDKVVGGLNPAPESYFDTCDFVGFLVQNRDVFKRIPSYPPFRAASSEHFLEGDPARSNPTAVRSLLDNADYLKFLAGETDPAAILQHPVSQEITTNAELRTWIQGIDTKDLLAYLTTGKSPKYSDERILGAWTYDYPAALMQAKKDDPDMLASELIRFRREMPERFERALLIATLDNSISIKLPARVENTIPPSATNTPPRVSYTGKWRKSGDKYELDLKTKSGAKGNFSPATIRKEKVRRGSRGEQEVERIYFRYENKPVCFDRIPE